MNNHYDNLQVSRRASEKVIRAAYKSLVQEWHPDRHPENVQEAERVLKIINRAYNVLSNPISRAEHDRWIDSHQNGAEVTAGYQENVHSGGFSRSQQSPGPVEPIVNNDPFLDQYAHPLKRFGAGVVDLVLMYIIGIVVGLLLAPSLAKNAIDQQQLESQLTGIGYILGWLYFSICESTQLQATPGKLLFGLRVSDLSGGRIGFWKSTGRHWGKLISALILLIGFLMIFFTKRKQGLHDILSGCLVLKNTGPNRENQPETNSQQGEFSSSDSVSASDEPSNMWVHVVVWGIAAVVVLAIIGSN